MQLFREARPQLILTDMWMPLMDGIEMAAGIKAIDPEVYFIGLTADNDRSILRTAANIGFSEYILKLFDHGTLSASISNFLAVTAPE